MRPALLLAFGVAFTTGQADTTSDVLASGHGVDEWWSAAALTALTAVRISS